MYKFNLWDMYDVCIQECAVRPLLNSGIRNANSAFGLAKSAKRDRVNFLFNFEM